MNQNYVRKCEEYLQNIPSQKLPPSSSGGASRPNLSSRKLTQPGLRQGRQSINMPFRHRFCRRHPPKGDGQNENLGRDTDGGIYGGDDGSGFVDADQIKGHPTVAPSGTVSNYIDIPQRSRSCTGQQQQQPGPHLSAQPIAHVAPIKRDVLVGATCKFFDCRSATPASALVDRLGRSDGTCSIINGVYGQGGAG
ncbi:hypothetical protein pipiens_009758 [Culex pipiens pipiens]|uniref:Uncharacterized protein n=1 Tax=Culex pipiens pipiens TaxID=38569 RepID=A0ABD1DCQ1_CULPP